MSLVVRHVVMLVFLVGCLPKLGRYDIADDGGVRRDTPRRDAPRSDAPDAFVSGCTPVATCLSGCAQPWLLASIEDIPGGEECGGMVLRWSLAEGEDPCVCETLTAGGRVPPISFSMGFVPPATVIAVQEDDQVVAIDGNADRFLWATPATGQPVDVFAVAEPGGRLHAAVAMRMRGRQDIREIQLYDVGNGDLVDSYLANGELPLGLSVPSLTYSPRDPSLFRALKPGAYAAADVDLWADELLDMPPHTANREGFFLETIYSFFYEGTYRVTWIGERTDEPDRPSQLYTYNASVVRDDNRVPLGDTCNRGSDGLDYPDECDFIHAVPHPTDPSESFALCNHDNGRRIVRIEHIGLICHDVAEAPFETARISKLAVGLNDFWD